MSLYSQLTEEQKTIVKSTIPLLESAGPELTLYFYKRMFRENPELKNVFNMSHQTSGAQPFALFSALAAYATNIDDITVLTAAVSRIANKHTSLNIQPADYQIVGHHLIESLRELAPDALTEEVEAAWKAAYGALAEVFINAEEDIYKFNESKDNGWRGAKEFRLVEKKIESELVKSLVFEPTDGTGVSEYQAGQYIGIQLTIPGQENTQLRQYSLSDKPNGENYRISVKREIIGTPGIVSNYLHDGLRLGDTVNLFAPAGDFLLKNQDRPIVLISAGVGITPMQSIVETLADKSYDYKVSFLHACETPDQHSFKKRIKALQGKLNLTSHTWYKNEAVNSENIHHGFMDLSQIQDELPINDGDFYLCGPVAFMQFAKQQLTTLGIDSDRIIYEVFGPHKDF